MYDDFDATADSAERTSASDARLSTLFHESTAEVDPDVPGLVQGGIARGRVKRRHRNAGASLAAAAVVGVVGLGVSIAPSMGSGDAVIQPAGPVASSSPQPPATTTTDKTATDKTAPTKRPTGPIGGAVADIPVKAADLPRLFTKLYPGKVTPAEKRTGRIINNGREGQYAHFLWNGFTTTVGFGAYYGTPAERCRELQQAEQPPATPARPPVTCTARPDGTVLMPWRDTWRFSPGSDDGGVAQGVSLLTKDGYDITVISYNTARKQGPALAAEPPFTISQMTQAVTSDVWFR